MQIVKALQWLTFSARPLRLKELVETFAIDPNKTPRFDPERRLDEPRDILTLCSSLITLADRGDDDPHGESNSGERERSANSLHSHSDSVAESSDAYVRLAHFSVKEYLVSDRIQHGAAPHYSIQEIDSHDVLARDCVAYLLKFDEPGSLTSETMKTSPLGKYAAEFWVTHAKVAEKGPTQASTLLAMELFMTEREEFLNWIRIYNIDAYGERDLSLKLDDIASPLYYAALAGLSEPVRLLIEAGKGVNSQGGKYGNALQAASFGGYTDVVHLLLDNGADGKAQGGIFGNALQAASFRGRIDIVQLLLDNGADINAQGGIQGNALKAALHRRFEDVALLLIENGAHGGDDVEPLIAACGLRHQDGLQIVVKLLLEKGADVNAFDKETGRTALLAASAHGHENVVKMLLVNGADVNLVAETSTFGTALQAASEHGHETIVKALLENGADMNALAEK